MSSDPLRQDIEKLHHLEHFLRLCAHIYAAREEQVKKLYGADEGKIREISGKIQAYEDVLELVDWDSIRSRAAQL